MWKIIFIEGFPAKQIEHRYLYKINDTIAGPSDWNWIWKIPCVHKVQIFIQKCCHNRLPTRYFLANIHHDIDPTYPRCSHVETTSHVIRYCPWAKEFWTNLPGQKEISFFHSPLVKRKYHQYKPCRAFFYTLEHYICLCSLAPLACL